MTQNLFSAEQGSQRRDERERIHAAFQRICRLPGMRCGDTRTPELSMDQLLELTEKIERLADEVGA